MNGTMKIGHPNLSADFWCEIQIHTYVNDFYHYFPFWGHIRMFLRALWQNAEIKLNNLTGIESVS